MALIAFPEERVQRPAIERTCVCGSTWFRLERTNRVGERTGGVVQVTVNGDVVSYSGEFICNDCGKHQ